MKARLPDGSTTSVPFRPRSRHSGRPGKRRRNSSSGSARPTGYAKAPTARAGGTPWRLGWRSMPSTLTTTPNKSGVGGRQPALAIAAGGVHLNLPATDVAHGRCASASEVSQKVTLRPPTGVGAQRLPSGDAPVEHVPTVSGVGPNLARPASRVDSLRPGLAGENARALELIEGVVPWLCIDDDRPTLAANDHRQLLPLEARDGDDAGHGQQERDVLVVVDFVEETLSGRFDVHRGREQERALDRHHRVAPLGPARVRIDASRTRWGVVVACPRRSSRPLGAPAISCSSRSEVTIRETGALVGKPP